VIVGYEILDFSSIELRVYFMVSVSVQMLMNVRLLMVVHDVHPIQRSV